MVYERRDPATYPQRDLVPEHTKRETPYNKPLNVDVQAAYSYVDSILDTSDFKDSYAWHGWALREAFLAGVSRVEMQLAAAKSDAKHSIAMASQEIDKLNRQIKIAQQRVKACGNAWDAIDFQRKMDSIDCVERFGQTTEQLAKNAIRYEWLRIHSGNLPTTILRAIANGDGTMDQAIDDAMILANSEKVGAEQSKGGSQ